VGAGDYSRDWRKRRDEENALTGMVTERMIASAADPDSRKNVVPLSGCQGNFLQDAQFFVVKPQKRVVFWVKRGDFECFLQ
jgi:hypothetical protein